MYASLFRACHYQSKTPWLTSSLTDDGCPFEPLFCQIRVLSCTPAARPLAGCFLDLVSVPTLVVVVVVAVASSYSSLLLLSLDPLSEYPPIHNRPQAARTTPEPPQYHQRVLFPVFFFTPSFLSLALRPRTASRTCLLGKQAAFSLSSFVFCLWRLSRLLLPFSHSRSPSAHTAGSLLPHLVALNLTPPQSPFPGPFHSHPQTHILFFFSSFNPLLSFLLRAFNIRHIAFIFGIRFY